MKVERIFQPYNKCNHIVKNFSTNCGSSIRCDANSSNERKKWTNRLFASVTYTHSQYSILLDVYRSINCFYDVFIFLVAIVHCHPSCYRRRRRCCRCRGYSAISSIKVHWNCCHLSIWAMELIAIFSTSIPFCVRWSSKSSTGSGSRSKNSTFDVCGL